MSRTPDPVPEPRPASDAAPSPGRSRPPEWLWRALAMAAVTAMAAVLAWNAITSLANLLLMLLCSLFVGLAIEPPVNWLVKRK
ncbi:MAG: AI-2E family transporter, partial [Bifidobacteriaceae bacterium]|nr:AI-2E family transporter [Bifidobacteriaceae bacterium]